MPIPATRIEIHESAPGLVVAGAAAPDFDQVTDATYLRLADPGFAELSSFHPELTSQQVRVVTLLSEGKTLNQIREKVGGSRGNVVAIEQAAQDELGVETPSALVHQAIVHNILPVALETDESLASRVTPSDRYALRSYAAGVPVDRIAGTLRMTTPQFIKYEPVLLHKVGAKKRPQGVRRGHELGLLPR